MSIREIAEGQLVAQRTEARQKSKELSDQIYALQVQKRLQENTIDAINEEIDRRVKVRLDTPYEERL